MNFCFNKVTESGGMFVVSAPSGAGKTTLCKAVCKKIPNLVYSVSYTTRLPRLGEIEGVDYFFISNDEFKKRVSAGTWAEWAEVHGKFYGTSVLFLEKHISKKSNVLLDLDVQGAQSILNSYSNVISIFIMPPSLEVLKERLFGRGLDDPYVVLDRLSKAKAEIERRYLYQYVIVNDDLDRAVNDFTNIIMRNI